MTAPVCGCMPPCGLPTCTRCGEDHGGIDHGTDKLCRDCNLDWFSTRMQCSKCRHQRYSPKGRNAFGQLVSEYMGSRCVCEEPLPMTVWEQEGLS